MEVGIVFFFNAKRGFGFIRPRDGGDDVFVHHSNIAVGKPGHRNLEQDQTVEFERGKYQGKDIAINVRPVVVAGANNAKN